MNKLNKAIKLVKNFFNEYLVNRNYNNTICLLHKDITWYGTGSKEICNTYDETCLLIKHHLELIQSEFIIDLKDFKAQLISKDVYIVRGFLSAETIYNQNIIKFKGRRVTAVCTKENNTLKIIHFHMSIPNKFQLEDRFYPITSTEKLLQGIYHLNPDILYKYYRKMISKYSSILSENKKLILDNQLLRKKMSLDSLTGLLNHSAIINYLEEESLISYRKNYPLCITMVDVDFFKNINDTYGHTTGDCILIELSNLLKEKILPYGKVGRYGGEEFLFFLRNMNLHQALYIIEDIRQSIENTTFTNKKIKITSSFGIIFANINEKINSIIDRADLKLYEAKNCGRNCIKY